MQVATVGLSNVAVQYLQYPTHILFKSAKPIPTVLAGRYPARTTTSGHADRPVSAAAAPGPKASERRTRRCGAYAGAYAGARAG